MIRHKKSVIHPNDNVCAVVIFIFSLFIETFLKYPKIKTSRSTIFAKKKHIFRIQSHTYVNIFSDTYAHSEKFSDGLN